MGGGVPHLKLGAAALAAWTALHAVVFAQGDLTLVLQRIGQYVEHYYSRAQSLVAAESVVLHTLRPDFVSDGFPRRLTYELRVDWTPRLDGEPARATMIRQLVSVNGRKPKRQDEPECLDPRTEQTEPMSMLLPESQKVHAFSWAGYGRIDKRRVAMIDFRETVRPTESAEWTDDCVSVAIDGRSAGRIWADPLSGEVLRIDVRLRGLVDFRVPRERTREWGLLHTLERSDYSVRYKPVTFTEPDETLLLPSSIESVAAWRGMGSQRHRKVQTFSNYRRFVAEGRLVDSAESPEPLVEGDAPKEKTPTR